MITRTGLALRREAVLDLFPMPTVLKGHIGHSVHKLADHPDSYLNIMLGAKGILGHYLGEALAYYRQHQLQESNTPEDPAEMLRREIDVGELGSVVWSNHMGMKRQGTRVQALLGARRPTRRAFMELQTADDLSKGSDRSYQVSPEELQAGPKAIACTTFRFHGPAPVDETLVRLQGITRSVQTRQSDFRRAKVAPGRDPHRHRIQVTGR